MKMALSEPLFTLDGGVKLFWAAFDVHVTVIPLKVALGLEQQIFLGISKNYP